MGQNYLTYAQVKEIYGISSDTLRRAVQRGELKRMGTLGKAFFRADEVRQWFEAPKIQTPRASKYQAAPTAIGSGLQGW